MIEIYYLDGNVKKFDLNTVNDLKDLGKSKIKNIWVDSTNSTKEEIEIIKNHFQLHNLTAEDLFTQNTRIKVEEFDNYLFSVFYGIKKHKDKTFFFN
ncbi:MAG: CorA family divalent cation transporter [Candidatus Woesearchaeota archaeon]